MTLLVLAVVAASELAAAGGLRLYKGPKRPSEEVAAIERVTRLSRFWQDLRIRVRIVEVDGIKIPGVKRIEVLPGRHVVKVRYSLGHKFGPDRAELAYFTDGVFLAEAGRSYIIAIEPREEPSGAGLVKTTWKLAVRDAKTEEKVEVEDEDAAEGH